MKDLEGVTRKEGKTETALLSLVLSPARARADPGQSQHPGTPAEAPTGAAGAQHLGHGQPVLQVHSQGVTLEVEQLKFQPALTREASTASSSSSTH